MKLFILDIDDQNIMYVFASNSYTFVGFHSEKTDKFFEVPSLRQNGKL